MYVAGHDAFPGEIITGRTERPIVVLGRTGRKRVLTKNRYYRDDRRVRTEGGKHERRLGDKRKTVFTAQDLGETRESTEDATARSISRGTFFPVLSRRYFVADYNSSGNSC